MTEQTEVGTLSPGEIHPSANAAFHWVKQFVLEQGNSIFSLQESMASCAIEGNRLGEVCGETLKRFMSGETISDRYLLGLAWFLKDMEERRKQSIENILHSTNEDEISTAM